MFRKKFKVILWLLIVGVVPVVGGSLLLNRTEGRAPAPPALVCKFSFSYQQIKEFSAERLKSEIKKALEYRIDQCSNVYFDEVTRSGLCDFGEQMPTDFTKPLTNSRGQCWAIGNSFRFDKERRDANGKTNYIRKDAYDADQGTLRIFGMESPSGDNKNGIILTFKKGQYKRLKEAPFSHTYIYWLNMPDQHYYVGEFFVGKIVANYDNWDVRVLSNGLVELKCDWKLALNKDVVGKVTYSLDPVKGFLPVSCYGIWKNPVPGVVFSQYEMRFVVDDSKLVNGLWMPIKLRDAICPNGESKKGNLNITTVKEVKLGTTKKPDLCLEFPEGTNTGKIEE